MNHSDKWHMHSYACLTTCVLQHGYTDSAIAHTDVFYLLHFLYISTKIKTGAGGSQLLVYDPRPAVAKGINTANSVFSRHIIPPPTQTGASNYSTQYESNISTSSHTFFSKSNTSCTNY